MEETSTSTGTGARSSITTMPVTSEAWRTYREKGNDVSGRIIETITARAQDFIIYTTLDNVKRPSYPRRKETAILDYHIEGTEAARANLSEANVLGSKIHSLAPRKSKHRYIIDKQLYAAYEMALRGRLTECATILEDILDQLTASQTADGQLFYMLMNVFGCSIAWIGYCIQLHCFHKTSNFEPWLLAGALGTTGGVLSVAINLKTIDISLHEKWYLQWFAGWNRNIIAFLAGIVCLLVIRSKIALGIAVNTEADFNAFTTSPQILEIFFCFLAGFSESLVPNILRDSEKGSSAIRLSQKKDDKSTNLNSAKQKGSSEITPLVDPSKKESEEK